MDIIQVIGVGSEPGEGLIPPVRVGLLLGREKWVVPSRLPCRPPGPLGGGRRRNGLDKMYLRFAGTLQTCIRGNGTTGDDNPTYFD